MVRVVCLLALALFASAYGYKRYDGYKVLQVTPEIDDHVHALVKMHTVLGFEVDFWREPKRVGRYIDFMVAPEQEKAVRDYLAGFGITPKVMVNDVSVLVDRSMKEQAEKPEIDWKSVKADPLSFPINVYHTHADINTWLQLVASTYPNFVSIASLGKTHEGRDMMFLKIGTPKANKNALWIDAGIHAREWISDATAIYTIYQLVKGYATTYKQLLDSIDIYVAPSVNPDGYEYSRLHDRNWRKTRSGPRGSSGCYGVDPNRNWPFHWGESGVSSNPCSEIYDGPQPMTEPNCINMKKFLDANAKSIKGMLTLHSYGEDMLYPWGYAVNQFPPDVQDLIDVGNQAAAAVKKVHGTTYAVVNSAGGLYPAAGASDDYSKSIGIKWVYTIELRPGDGDHDNDHQYGFDLPAKFIIPTAEEMFPGLLVWANRIMTGPN